MGKTEIMALYRCKQRHTYVPRGKRSVTVEDCGVEEVEGGDVNDDGAAKKGSSFDKRVVGLLNWRFLE